MIGCEKMVNSDCHESSREGSSYRTLLTNFDMEAPDKIYLHRTTGNPRNNGKVHSYKPAKIRDDDKIIEYIRKDALLEWAKDMHEAYRKKYEESNHTCGEHWGQMVAFRKMINKLNSL